MEELCTACLCTGRNLHFIGETGFYDLYSQILNEIPVYDTSRVCIRVCWECRAILHRLHQFKARVKHSYQLLIGCHENNVSSLARAPRLGVHSPPGVTCPGVAGAVGAAGVKDEVEVKEELDAEHSEETFVHDYNGRIEDKLIQQKDTTTKVKPKKLKQKKVIKKKTHTKKRRKKSISTEESFDHLDVNDTDSIDNDNKDNVIEGHSEEGVLNEGVFDEGVLKEGVTEERVLEKKEKLKCPDCDVQFEVESELIAHIETNHKEVECKRVCKSTVAPPPCGERPVCAECGKVFSSTKTYRYHLNVLHKGQNKHQCPRCGKVYQWKSNLGRHIRSHKARDAGELYCSLCDKRFASVATYRQHLRVSRRHVSENDFSFVCTSCGKKFVNKTRLQDHVDWEHLNKIKFQCQLCHKPFKCHTSLYVHLQNVHRNKEKKDNLCHVCGKSYQNAAKLKYHIVAMHTSETPYSCGQCAAAFGWYSSLYRHVREVHHKVKQQSNKSKKSKRRPPDMMPLAQTHPPHE